MFDVIIVRYAEIALKGKNRIDFEKRLISNICKSLTIAGVSFERIKLIRGRILVYTSHSCYCLRKVFGISSFSPAISCSIDIDTIWKNSEKILPQLNSKSFRVSTQRVDKSCAIKSIDVDREIGSRIVDRTGARVSLKNFDFELCVEIIYGKAFVFSERIAGPGGLPVGTQENVFVSVCDPRGLLSALLLMKRGCSVTPVILGSLGKSGDTLLLLNSFGCSTTPIICKNYHEVTGILAGGSGILAIGNSLDDVSGILEQDLFRDFLILLPCIALSDAVVKVLLDSYAA